MNVRNMPRDDEYLTGPDAVYLSRMFSQLRGNFPGRKQFAVLALDRVGETKSNVINRDAIVDLPDGGFHTNNMFVCTFINKRDQYPWHGEERCLDWLMHKLKEEALWQSAEKTTTSYPSSSSRTDVNRATVDMVDANNNCPQQPSHTIHIFTYYSPCWKCSDLLRELAEFLKAAGLSESVRVTVGFLEAYTPLEGTQEKSDSCLEQLADLERDFKDFITLGYLPPTATEGGSKKSPLHYERNRQIRPPLKDITARNNGRWNRNKFDNNAQMNRDCERRGPVISHSAMRERDITGNFHDRRAHHHHQQRAPMEGYYHEDDFHRLPHRDFMEDNFCREPRGHSFYEPEHHHSWENDVIGGKLYRPQESNFIENERNHAPWIEFTKDQCNQEREYRTNRVPVLPHETYDNVPHGRSAYHPGNLDRNRSSVGCENNFIENEHFRRNAPGRDFNENEHYPHNVYRVPRVGVIEESYYQERENRPPFVPRAKSYEDSHTSGWSDRNGRFADDYQECERRPRFMTHEKTYDTVPPERFYHSGRLDRTSNLPEDYREHNHRPSFVPHHEERFDDCSRERTYHPAGRPDLHGNRNFTEDVDFRHFKYPFQVEEEVVRQCRPGVGKHPIRRRFVGQHARNIAPYARHPPSNLASRRMDPFRCRPSLDLAFDHAYYVVDYVMSKCS